MTDARREWDRAYRALCGELQVSPRLGHPFEGQLLRSLARAEGTEEDLADLYGWLRERVQSCGQHEGCVIHEGVHWRDM